MIVTMRATCLKLGLSTVLLTILAAGSLRAEEPKQTPENAQAFLEKVVEQGGVTLSMDTGKGMNKFPARQRNCDPSFRKYNSPYIDSSGCQSWSEWENIAHEPFNITNAQQEANQTGSYCGTRFDATIKSGIHPNAHFQIEFAPPKPPLLVSWNSVSKVEQTGEAVMLKGNPSFMVRFSSDQLATRAAYAMEFLRQSCDSTASTGF